jgi:hypothetical protein
MLFHRFENQQRRNYGRVAVDKRGDEVGEFLVISCELIDSERQRRDAATYGEVL